MRLKRLDLNLLVALDALLTLRSVTAAANKVHVTQPSMSASLARLRGHFQDPLLLQVGRSMELTSLAKQLVDPVRETLRKIDQTISLRSDFDSATSTRSFSMCASDGTVLVLLADVVARLATLAPGVTVNLLPAEHTNAAAMLGREELDFVFSGPTFVIGDQPHATVIRDHYVCLVWQHNAKIKRQLSLGQYVDAGHVVARFGFERRLSYEEHQMRQLGVHRRVEVSCSSVALLGALLVGTDRIATVPSRLARLLSASHPLRIMRVPLEMQPQRIDAYWHRGRDQDPASQWFRDALVRTSRELGMLDLH